MKVKMVIVFLFIVLNSCVVYNPAYRIEEVVNYNTPASVILPESIKKVLISAENNDEINLVDKLMDSMYAKKELLPFELVPAEEAGKLYSLLNDSDDFSEYDIDGFLYGFCENINVRFIKGKDNYEFNFIVNLVEFFSEKEYTDYNFSIRVDREIPDEVFDSTTGSYVTNITEESLEMATDVMVLSFDYGFRLIDVKTNKVVYSRIESPQLIYQLYEPNEFDVSVQGLKEAEIVSEYPIEKDIIEIKLTSAFSSFIRNLLPEKRVAKIEIWPMGDPEIWETIYFHLKYREYEMAIDKLFLQIEESSDKRMIAQLQYAIGSIYNLQGNEEEALKYLNIAKKDMYGMFRSFPENQIRDIFLRREAVVDEL